ncbi:MAG: phage major capsid protein [Oscillospiraceae bacterium]|jgi:HK97 family phage major capsid protein|nr:phage major capsid protein [Oscillospiraceae bacterium]
MATPTFDPANITMMDARSGVIPFAEADGILSDVTRGSAYMQLAKAVPMTKPIEKFTHISGVGAYWVSEAERIQTSKPTWLHPEMRAYKLGVIIPTTKENLRYSVTDFFERLRPEIAEAFAKKFDAAAFAGVDSPYAQNIAASAAAAGNVFTETDSKYEDMNTAMAAIEAEDLDPNGIASTNRQKKKYRGTLDAVGLPIFTPPTEGTPATVLGLPAAFMSNAAFGVNTIAEIVGDWNNAYYGILQGIEYEILTEATLTTVTDSGGEPISLAERDMAALKATMMIGMMVVKDAAFAVVNLEA